MSLLEKIISSLPANPEPVRRVIVGAHWTLVSSKYCGLASTIVSESHGHAKVREVGHLHKKSAQELAAWALSDNTLEASIGMAALNSLLPVDDQSASQVNAAEVIARECRGKNLVVVGHFPFVDQMKTIASHCWVVEKHPSGDDCPEEAAEQLLPQADVVAITGTAFINHTIEKLLSLRKPGAVTIILGPSTPLTRLLFDEHVSFLSGARVLDEEAAILTIQQGASFPQVQGTRLYTMAREQQP
jgi:uncharacterized protein (DUF4213/DUF364 family)